MENNVPSPVADIDRVILKLLDKTFRTLDHVQNVSDLKKNLILFATFDSKEYEFIYGDRILKVCKGAVVVLEGRKKFQLYILEGRTKSLKNIQERFSSIANIQFGILLLDLVWSRVEEYNSIEFRGCG